jgi:hypothetical protein
VLAKIHDPRLRAYVVWVPKRHGAEKDVDEATTTVPDERSHHFWDETGYLVHAFDLVLGLGQDAWDVYLLYGPDARWDGPSPPAPMFWMHQLWTDKAPELDPTVFATRVREALGT